MPEPTARSRLVPLTSFRNSFWTTLVLCAAVLGVILSTPQSAQAGSKIATLNHNTGEFAVGYPHQRKVLRDASGYWYVVYLLFNGQGLPLGEATARAKAATSDQDMRRTWILFGDPTTRLKP